MGIKGDLWELVHLVMEAEKSYSMLSAAYRPKKGRDIVQSKSEYLRIRRASAVNLGSLKDPEEAGKDACPSLRKETIQLSFRFSICVLFGTPMD